MKITSFVEYNKRAAETQMESCKNENYLRLGLISEIGELAAIFKRAIRGDFKLEDKRQDILLELGDICWYLDRLQPSGYTLPYIDNLPIEKCSSTVLSVFRLSSNATNHWCYNSELFFDIIAIAEKFEFTIWDVLNANVEKLAKRKERGMITGSGDHRGEEGGAE